MAIWIGSYPALELSRNRLRMMFRQYAGQSQLQSPMGRWMSVWGWSSFRARERQRALLIEFFSRHEILSSILCQAAQEGISQELITRYSELRSWLIVRYHRIRPLIRPYLGEWVGPLDPCEELFAPDNLEAVINAPYGIAYASQTSQAVQLCRKMLEIDADH